MSVSHLSLGDTPGESRRESHRPVPSRPVPSRKYLNSRRQVAVAEAMNNRTTSRKEPNVSDARETVAFRNRLQQWLDPGELRQVAWPVLTRAAADALARGWTGDELARWCIADLAGNPPENPGAVMLTTIRALAQTDPPRDTTPIPDDIAGYRAERARAIEAARGVDHARYAEKILRGGR